MRRPADPNDPKGAPRARRAKGGVALLATLLGAGTSLHAAPPERLADTGLYADFARRTIAPANFPFAPQYPLWTDGAAKRRWIYLPPGTVIDASDPDAWVFPAGTRLWKEFRFDRRYETRYMELDGDGTWHFATYLWNEDESDARLAPPGGVRAFGESAPGVRYDVPGRWDCTACHEGNVSRVLGFSALQLSSDRDPLAPNATAPEPGSIDLDALVARGLVRGLPETLRTRPPRVAAATAEERAALGYLHGNCSSCHNDRGPLAALGMSLEVRLVPSHGGVSGALSTAVSRSSRFRGAGADAVERITAGDPDRSVLMRRVASRSPLLQMPPLGTSRVDPEAIATLLTWIRRDLDGASRPLSHVVADSRSNFTKEDRR